MGFYDQNVKEFQTALNDLGGEQLKTDGQFGKKTLARAKEALEFLKMLATKNLKDNKVNVDPTPVASKTPWMDWMLFRLGWGESSHEEELAQYWPLVNLKFKDIIGRTHAWCRMIQEAAFHETGFKGIARADAASVREMGVESDLVYGAALCLQHPDGSFHTTFFAGWADKKNQILVGLGGNQGDKISKANFNVSGRKNGHNDLVAVRMPVRA